LYFRGDEEDNSYINTWRIQKLKYGYRIRPRTAKHHTSELKLKDLWAVHENGATITHPSGTVFRIPPRPAWRKAQERFLKQRLREETVDEVRKAIRSIIRTGRAAPVSRFVQRAKKEARKHEHTT
jgi:hypothetical protein